MLEPGAQAENCRRGNNGELVTTALGARPYDRAEQKSRVLRHWDAGGTRLNHSISPIEQLEHIDADDRPGRHAKVGERRVAAAD